MRSLLKKLGYKQINTYRAIVGQFGFKFSRGYFKHPIRTVLLKDITQDGMVVTDHLWFDVGEKLAEVKEGDLIQFSATVDVYVKGYFGKRDRRLTPKTKSVDYSLANIDNVQILAHKKGGKNGR